MKLIYIANIRLPTEKAHGSQIARTCSALASSGVELELILPSRFNTIIVDPFSFYGLKRNFKIRRVFCVDFVWASFFSSFTFTLRALTFTLSVLALFFFRVFGRSSVFYGRDELVLSLISFFSSRVVWETHSGKKNLFSRVLMRRARGIVCITRGLKDYYESLGVPTGKLSVIPDAVDLEYFTKISSDKKELRKRLGLEDDVKIITYSGSLDLYSWKGIDVFLEIVKFLPEDSFRFLVVGGWTVAIEDLKNKHPDSRIIFAGWVSPKLVPVYLKASDVLVLPNKSGDIVSERFTSPMKLFEYMASERPIVASRLPSICEVLNEENSILVTPDDPIELANGIASVLSDEKKAAVLSARAFKDVEQYSWVKRAEAIISLLRGVSGED